MARTITLADVVILSWTVNPLARHVTAAYKIVDSTGAPYRQGEAVFWVTLPAPPLTESGQPGVNPANWFLLPVEYHANLLNLTAAVRAGLLGLLE